MSKIVARMEKMKSENLQGIQRHNQRETDNHSNKEIDVAKSHLNYDLVNANTINYQEKVKEIIESQRISTRAVRKDAVLVDEWIITSDTAFFENKTDTMVFFQTAVDYFSQRCGVLNIAYATVHHDETTPHMHLGIVPMIEGKLSSKQMFDRKALKEIQEELPVFLQEKGHAIERGIKGSERKHLTVEEFKANKQEIQKMEKHLESLKTEVVDMQKQKEVVNDRSYELWHDEWLDTQKDFPDFSMTYPLPVLEDTLTNILVDQDTPRRYQLNFSEVFQMFKEKIKHLKTYITEKLKKLTIREDLATDKENRLADKEKSLYSKLEGLHNEIGFKEHKSEHLTTLIEEKTTYIEQLARNSELAVAIPSYVRPSKLNKDMLLVPKDKWEAKHISANTISDMMSIKHIFGKVESRMKRENQIFEQNSKLLRENTVMETEIYRLKSDNIKLWNGLADLINKNLISKEVAKQLNLPKDFQKEFKLINQQTMKEFRRDFGPRL